MSHGEQSPVTSLLVLRPVRLVPGASQGTRSGTEQITGEPVAAAMRITGPEWRRKWQRNRSVSGALIDQCPEIAADRLPGPPVSDTSGQVVPRDLVTAALGRLTQDHRDVLRECCQGGSSVAQAAQALGIAPSTVQSRIYYALRALRLAIEELGGVE